MSLPLTTGSWTLDPAHSVVDFTVGHLGISKIRGRFLGITATLDVGDELADTSLTADIDMSTVDTGNADRDGHLRSTDIFDAETHPTMRFVSTSIADAGDGAYRLNGDLTIHGVTRSEQLDVAFSGTGANPLDGSTRAGFEATGRIDRTAYGIEWNVPLPAGGFMLANEIDLTISAQLVGPASD